MQVYWRRSARLCWRECRRLSRNNLQDWIPQQSRDDFCQINTAGLEIRQTAANKKNQSRRDNDDFRRNNRAPAALWICAVCPFGNNARGTYSIRSRAMAITLPNSYSPSRLFALWQYCPKPPFVVRSNHLAANIGAALVVVWRCFARHQCYLRILCNNTIRRRQINARQYAGISAN